MLLLSSAGAALSAQVDQLQKDVDALKADARAKEKTWTGLDRRNVRLCIDLLIVYVCIKFSSRLSFLSTITLSFFR